MRDGRDVYYDEIIAAADPACPAEPLDAEHPLYILYTSGSTAKPKGILHTTGGYLTGVSATHRYVFDLHEDSDVYWCAAFGKDPDLGWYDLEFQLLYSCFRSNNGCHPLKHELKGGGNNLCIAHSCVSLGNSQNGIELLLQITCAVFEPANDRAVVILAVGPV